MNNIHNQPPLPPLPPGFEPAEASQQPAANVQETHHEDALPVPAPTPSSEGSLRAYALRKQQDPLPSGYAEVAQTHADRLAGELGVYALGLSSDSRPVDPRGATQTTRFTLTGIQQTYLGSHMPPRIGR